MLRIVWAPQAVDILRDQLSFSSSVSGIPLSLLHKNPLGSSISRLLELSDFSGMWLRGLPLHPSYANVSREVLSLETSCVSGPLNESNSVTLRVGDPLKAQMEDERTIPS